MATNSPKYDFQVSIHFSGKINFWVVKASFTSGLNMIGHKFFTNATFLDIYDSDIAIYQYLVVTIRIKNL